MNYFEIERLKHVKFECMKFETNAAHLKDFSTANLKQDKITKIYQLKTINNLIMSNAFNGDNVTGQHSLLSLRPFLLTKL